jgi:hypothetical protein
MSSSQLTNPYFSKGLKPPTRDVTYLNYHGIYVWVFFKGMCICFFPISLYGIIYGFIWGFMIIYDDLCLGFTSGWVYVWDIFSDSRENPSNNSSMD